MVSALFSVFSTFTVSAVPVIFAAGMVYFPSSFAVRVSSPKVTVYS